MREEERKVDGWMMSDLTENDRLMKLALDFSEKEKVGCIMVGNDGYNYCIPHNKGTEYESMIYHIAHFGAAYQKLREDFDMIYAKDGKPEFIVDLDRKVGEILSNDHYGNQLSKKG